MLCHNANKLGEALFEYTVSICQYANACTWYFYIIMEELKLHMLSYYYKLITKQMVPENSNHLDMKNT